MEKTIGTCKECEHFIIDKDLGDGWGTCSLFSFDSQKDCESELAFISAGVWCEGSADSGDLCVSLDFGCIHFQQLTNPFETINK